MNSLEIGTNDKTAEIIVKVKR